MIIECSVACYCSRTCQELAYAKHRPLCLEYATLHQHGDRLADAIKPLIAAALVETPLDPDLVVIFHVRAVAPKLVTGDLTHDFTICCTKYDERKTRKRFAETGWDWTIGPKERAVLLDSRPQQTIILKGGYDKYGRAPLVVRTFAFDPPPAAARLYPRYYKPDGRMSDLAIRQHLIDAGYRDATVKRTMDTIQAEKRAELTDDEWSEAELAATPEPLSFADDFWSCDNVEERYPEQWRQYDEGMHTWDPSTGGKRRQTEVEAREQGQCVVS